MARLNVAPVAVIVAFGGILLSLLLSRQPNAALEFDNVIGRNNTALFLVTGNAGLSNVHFATAQALLENHPGIQVHFASSDVGIAAKLDRISSHARAKTPGAKEIVFHEIPGPSYVKACQNAGVEFFDTIQPPGYRGMAKMCENLQVFVAPWTGEDHLTIYRAIQSIIAEVDPAVTILDTLFRPAIDAVRSAKRVHAVITPNTLVETFVADQPYLGMLWKYPALGSDFGFPVPWHKIPENIYISIRLGWSMLRLPGLGDKKRFLKEEGGIKDPLSFYKLHRPDVPWITQTTEGASTPVDVVPENVTCTGPIVLDAAPAAEQDPELVTWMRDGTEPASGAHGRTLLVNLGSSVIYSLQQAETMANALRQALDKFPSTKVLWKLRTDIRDEVEIHAAVEKLLGATLGERVRVVEWLTVDPVSLLETGHVVASVHHGGSNCFHEAISAGVPQVILPLWMDLYNLAMLAEETGVGVYASRGSAPDWTVDGLVKAFERVLDDEQARTMRDKSAILSARAKERPGREIAADVVADLAGSGH
ncbi:unnamed protein product [Discula destructiva]